MNNASINFTDPANFQKLNNKNIRIADTDAGGHINNTILEAYVGNGRVARLRLAMFDRARGKRWVIAHLEINFDAEAEPPGQVSVGTRLVAIGTKSVTLGAGLFKDDACIATAQSIMVFLNGTNTVPIPQRRTKNVCYRLEDK